MKGDVTTAITLENFDAPSRKFIRGSDDVRGLGIAPESDHRRVFEKQKNVTDAIFFAKLDKLLLQAQASCVIKRAELKDRDQVVYALIANPYTLLDASSMASASVG